MGLNHFAGEHNERRVLTVDTLASPHLGHYYLDGFSVLDLP